MEAELTTTEPSVTIPELMLPGEGRAVTLPEMPATTSQRRVLRRVAPLMGPPTLSAPNPAPLGSAAVLRRTEPSLTAANPARPAGAFCPTEPSLTAVDPSGLAIAPDAPADFGFAMTLPRAPALTMRAVQPSIADVSLAAPAKRGWQSSRRVAIVTPVHGKLHREAFVRAPRTTGEIARPS